MASETADEDDIWFGSDFRLNESQELEYIGDDYSKDGIVKEAAVVGERQEACIIPESQQENPDPTENNENLDLKPKAKRNTMVYSQKKLLAKLDLFLDPLYHDKFEVFMGVQRSPQGSTMQTPDFWKSLWECNGLHKGVPCKHPTSFWECNGLHKGVPCKHPSRVVGCCPLLVVGSLAIK
jgi:hypothetical protein